MEYSFFATVPRGLEAALASELTEMGLPDVETRVAGVVFRGPLSRAYRACLWSRVASRVLLNLHRYPAPTPEALYEGAYGFPWEEHFGLRQTFAVTFVTTRSAITHTNFGALKVKDAVVDRFREKFGERPSVKRQEPDISLHVHVLDDVATLSLDLAGESLHRRHYRHLPGPATLKENLAAGLLYLAAWPEHMKQQAPFVDPMCGSGTLCVEAALMAADVAPGLQRKRFGFESWSNHRQDVWRSLRKEAQARDKRKRGQTVEVLGFDADPRSIDAATVNAGKARVPWIRFHRSELAMVSAPGTSGLLVTNPPYGERLGDRQKLKGLYRRIGATLKQRFHGFDAWLITEAGELPKHVGLRAASREIVYNGAIECRFLHYPILPPKAPTDEAPVQPPEPAWSPEHIQAEMFGNRLRKNRKRLKSWVKQTGVTCYRLYDADLPEFSASVDWYEGRAHVREYERPDSVDPMLAEARLHGLLEQIQTILDVPRDRIYLKQHARQKGTQQYETFGDSKEFFTVEEGGHRFLVNLADYFDTGLFLDHRPMRETIGKLASGKRLLNLFSYTGAVSVYAGAGGARSTVSVDLSNTYTDWARRNLELNGLSEANHRTIREDALTWLRSERGKYDLIFVDPPTFSNSKKMRQTLDVQRDHVQLLRMALDRLTTGGTLFFSNNFRRFKMEREAFPDCEIQEISRNTIPPDFSRSPRIHNAWKIRFKQDRKPGGR